MARWDDEDYWDDELEPSRPPLSRQDEEDVEPREAPLLPRPIQEQLEGSVYALPDSDWGFDADFRSWHPGACVRCDLAAEITFCFKGTDARRMREKYTFLLIHPTADNGLKKTTAFGREPTRIALETILRLHEEEGWIGEIDVHQLNLMRGELNWFLEEENKRRKP